MTTPRDPDRLIRAYLAEGPEVLPDQSYDTVRGDIDRTRQRVVVGPWREAQMNNLAKLAIGLAAVLVVAIGGWNLLPSAPGAGGLGPSAPPSPVPTVYPRPSGSPTAPGYMPPIGELAAGTYEAVSEFDLVPFSFTVPDGWTSEGWYITTSEPGTDRPDQYVSFVPVGNLYSDPCVGVLANPYVGATVEDLAVAAATIPKTEASPTVDVTLGGRTGKLVEYVVPESYACDLGKFMIWRDPRDGDLWEEAPYGETIRMWIMDVDGARFVITAVYHPTTSDADRAELQTIVDSVTFP
jgi:hypothetical protein